MPRIDKNMAGAAAPTTITGSMTSSNPGNGQTLTVASGTGWPTGPFVAVIDRGLATEEKVYFSGRSGTTLTVATGGRGYDGTTAAAHSSGAAIEHILDATTIQAMIDLLNQNGAAEDPFPQYLLETAHTLAAHTGLGLVGTSDSRLSDTRTPTDNSVTNAKMADNSVGTAELIALSVTAAKIANDTITATQIAADAIGTSELAADAVGNSELADNAVATANVQDGAITAVKTTGMATTAYADLVADAAHAGSVDMADTLAAAVVGTKPAVSATTWRIIGGNQNVVFTAGAGTLSLPASHGLNGILTWGAYRAASTDPVMIGRDTGGTTNKDQIALLARDKTGANVAATLSLDWWALGWE